MEITKRKVGLPLIATFTALLILSLASPAMAWGTSVKVASVDDTNSPNMGAYNPPDYPNQQFTNVPGSSISATILANYDTIIFWGFDPSSLTPSQKTDIVNWINNGGKLIIWDSEDSAPSGWDYSWLPYPFVSVGPGAWGASGYPLTIVEDNTLSSNDQTSPYYIDVADISQNSDAVGDSNIFTSLTSGWTEDMEAKNALGSTGPVHVYSQPGNGVVIYNGLDFDYGSFYGYSSGEYLRKILKQELDTSSLPSGNQWSGNLNVVKVSDKSQYQVGDPITFTITAENPATNQYTAEGVVLTDMPPAEISVSTTTYNLGNIAPGQSVTQTITAMATASGTGIKNEVNALGYYQNKPVFSGSGSVTFDVLSQPSNLPPVANAGADQVIEQSNMAGTAVTLDGSSSTDDGQISPLTYTWTWDGGSATGVNPTVTLPPGSTTVTLIVFDGQLSATDTVDITVKDTTPPTITALGNQKVLWPANHKYQTVSISNLVSSVTDICDTSVGVAKIEITSVSSDEPEEALGEGDGNTTEDIVIKSIQTVNLRAERQGEGNGRVYTINYKVMDASGNTATGSSQVWVPHDQGNGATSVDDGVAAGYTVNYP